MDDLTQRDFSESSFEDLSKSERSELRRRFQEFVTVMTGAGRASGKPEPEKPVTKWDPALHGRKH